MYSKTTNGITINVEPVYDALNSFPSANRFVFKYNIEIINNSDFNIKLNRRKWLIYDVGFGFTEVIGDGVIGLTPTILPDDSFSYFSNVALRSGVGTMAGTYFMTDIDSDEDLDIEIPKFNLLAEVLSN
ncbi:Co2+/Mg2+ efflux protein ApaG [Halpernia frigidisoli]|uniref:ApaG protein n=1 Tax=Halpernia frigidisoli TaxID=1125876 RepID=A0A1I3EB34_9FLAO|nr:Co2+/Mg2+ efflux protein ApaG [Halpernia frigidisoli]SFH96197.1 ApaG protein [Halpernia frigidisoli]